MGKTKKCTLFKAIFRYSLRNFFKLNNMNIYIVYIYIYIYIFYQERNHIFLNIN